MVILSLYHIMSFILNQVGMAAVQFARAYGMVVMGTAGTDEGMTLVRDFGAHFVFNHRQEDYTDQILVSIDSVAQLVMADGHRHVCKYRDIA